MLNIHPLTAADIPAALRLSTQAGWNQIEADWTRLLDLWPDSCLAGWDGDRLVATGTLAIYGTQVGWIGMILVDEACRGRGFGGAIFDAILKKADEIGVECLGLDATDLGRPVYLKRGFVDACAIHRWISEPGRTRTEPGRKATAEFDLDSLLVHLTPGVIAWDRRKSRVDRAALLRHIEAEGGAGARVLIGKDKSLRAAVIVRPGRIADHIGPVVAETAEDAGEIVELILNAESRAERPLFIDAMATGAFESVLFRMGFVMQRRLTRMMRPRPDSALTTRHVFAAGGFELG